MKHITTPSGSLSDLTGKAGRRSARRYKVLKSALTAVPTLIEALEQRTLLSISATGSAITPTEGAAFNGTVATFTDTTPSANPAAYVATINWGDATSSTGAVTLNAGTFTVAGTHTYAEDGSKATSITIAEFDDDFDTATAAGSAAVAEGFFNLGTAGPINTTEGQTFSGNVATFLDTGSPDPASAYAASITWGDGTTSAGSISGSAGNFTVGGTHAYSDELSGAVYGVTVTEPGANFTIGPVGNTVNVAEADVLSAPSPVTISPSEGTSFTGAVAIFTDAFVGNVAADFTGNINWGDGTLSSGTVSGSGASYTVSGTHTYAEEGSYTTSTTLTDDATGIAATAVTSGTATVGEVQITNLTGAGTTPTSNEGASTGAFTGLATFTDPAGAEAAANYTVNIIWGDGTTSSGAAVNTGGNNFRVDAPPHTYGEEGTDTVTVSVTHGAAATLTVTAATVTVNDVALTNVIGIAPATLTEGVPASGVVASFTDPAGAEPNASDPSGTHYTATINWGDGTTTAGTVAGNGGNNFVVNGNHTYADEGNFTITATVTHELLAPQTATSLVTVTEADVLQAGFTSSFNVSEGQAASGVVAAFADTNTAAPASDFLGTINWGDGTTSTGTVSGGSGTFTVVGSHTYAEEGSFIIATTLSDNAPGTATATAIGSATVTEVQLTNFTAGAIPTTSNEDSAIAAIAGIATFTDAGGAEPNASDPAGTANTHYTTLIHWGDGTSSPGNVVNVGGNNFRVDSTQHTYPEEGTYAVTLDVTHETAATLTVALGTITVSEVQITNLIGGGFTLSFPEGSVSAPIVGLATFTDPAGAEPNVYDPAGTPNTHYATTIHWGDGTSSSGNVANTGGNNFRVDSPGHNYTDEGAYVVTVDVKHEGAATLTVTAATVTATEADNLAPTSAPQTFTLNEGSAASGLSATFSDSGNPGNTASDFSASITWGDGTTTAGTVSGGGGSFTVSSSPHTYAEEGLFPVVVTLADNAPGTSSASITDQANVIDAPLSIKAVPFTSAEGAAAKPVLVATFTDANPNPDINDFSSNINWGDGGASSGTIIADPMVSGQFDIYGTHQYLEEGAYTAHVNVQDAGSGTGTDVAGTVTDPAVVATGGFTLAGVEGASTGSQVVATFTDPGGAEPNPADLGPIATHYSASITWGDGTPVDNTGVITFSAATQTFTVSGTHTYAEEGVFTPSIVIHHETAPNSNVVTDTANISDPAVVAVGGFNFTPVEGQTTGPIIVATFTDPGGAEPNAADPGAIATHYAATINWGDGTPADTSGVITFNAGVFSVTGSHIYAEESAADHSGSTPYIISVTIAHESAPVSNTVTDTATVSDPAVVASGAPDINGSEGQSLTATVATFTDPGGPEATGDYTATIDWGDGSTSTGTITADGVVVGQFDVAGTHTYAEESTPDHVPNGTDSFYTISVTISHENAPVSNTVTTNAFIDDPAVVATGGAPVTGVESQTTGPVVVATFTDPGGAEATGDYTAAIDWGDGTPVDTTGAISYNAATQTFSVTGAHIYDEESAPEHANSQPYTISVTISHENPPVNDSNTVTTTATIAELPVTGTALPNAASAVVGVSTGPVALAKFIDPGDAESLADYSATVNFHDGSAAAATTITYDGMTGYFTVTASHTYTTAGTFAAPTVTIVHETTTTVVQDKNPVTVSSPLAGSGKTISGLEGRLTSGTVASFTAGNSASAGNFTASINWGDGSTTPGTVVKDTAGHFHVAGSHVYHEQNTAGYALTITIKPTVGSSLVVNGLAKIADPPLVNGIGMSFSIKKGVAFSNKVLASFTDPDAYNTLPSYAAGTSSINWGDGSSMKLGLSNFKRTGSNASVGTFWQILAGHTFTSTGVKHVSILIQDGGGGMPPLTITLTITVTP